VFETKGSPNKEAVMVNGSIRKITLKTFFRFEIYVAGVQRFAPEQISVDDGPAEKLETPKFGDLLNHWQINAEKHAAAYELYMASLQTPLPHPEHQFVNLVWAFESLHRNWQREAGESERVTRRKERIQKILEKFGEPAEKKLRDRLKGKLRYAYEPNLQERIVEVFRVSPLR
jgi:hypothetical protein